MVMVIMIPELIPTKIRPSIRSSGDPAATQAVDRAEPTKVNR